MNSASQKVGNRICPKCLTSHRVTWNCEMVFPDTRANRPADGLVERLAEMDAATGLEKECLERATYLLAMKDEGQSTIMRQSMETLFKAATALRAQSDAEVERIVAWLRAEDQRIRLFESPLRNLRDAADAIERGEHRKDGV